MAEDANRPRDAFARRFVLKGLGEDAREAQEAVLGAIERCSYEPNSCFAIRLALEEALSNAFKHGNKNDPQKVVTLECHVDGGAVVIEVEDQGDGFDPGVVPDPTEDENLEIPSGRGIVLMKSFMTDVSFDPPGNRVRMTYRRSEASEAG
jgi:serine/threonine-protein kinase RsbW